MNATIKTSVKIFGGVLHRCNHTSQKNKCPMDFSVFLPPQHNQTSLSPYLVFLSGLTCTDENFVTKAGVFRKAAEIGLALLVPDTSPRGENVADDKAYDLGQGAGFYLDATEHPWAQNYQMESYLMQELLPLAETQFGLAYDKKSISGHSMGGHGALTLYYKYPNTFQSCSAFSPIVAPTQVPWGKKVFTAYLGHNEAEWIKHDACELVRNASSAQHSCEILIDQGLADNFLCEQLKPELFESACEKAGQQVLLRRHEGYDHSYFFIQTYIDDHIIFHAKKLF